MDQSHLDAESQPGREDSTTCRTYLSRALRQAFQEANSLPQRGWKLMGDSWGQGRADDLEECGCGGGGTSAGVLPLSFQVVWFGANFSSPWNSVSSPIIWDNKTFLLNCSEYLAPCTSKRKIQNIYLFLWFKSLNIKWQKSLGYICFVCVVGSVGVIQSKVNVFQILFGHRNKQKS